MQCRIQELGSIHAGATLWRDNSGVLKVVLRSLEVGRYTESKILYIISHHIVRICGTMLWLVERYTF